MVGGLLLPIGLWLLLSAGTPGQLHRRLAIASLIGVAVATLAFVAFGYALTFGARELSVGIGATPERWVFIGLSGFFLDGATDLESLRTFVLYWPLIAAGALSVAGALAQQARTATLTALTLVVAGIVLPIVGCWMWGGGWLSTLGTNAELGRGVVDLGHLSTIGLVAGAAGLAWLRAISRRELMPHEPELPPVHFPARAVMGVLLIMASTPAFVGAFAPDVPELPMGQFINCSIAVSAAILMAGAYTVFTTRRPDVLSASRAALAAVFITSSGGALLPMPVVVILGMTCGLLATVGYYAINEKLRWRDDSAIITAIFAPAAIGVLATGAFANGAFDIAGLLSARAGLASGQLIAQLIGLVVIASFAVGASNATLWLMKRMRSELVISTEPVYSQPPTSQPALSSVAVASAEFTDATQAVSLTYASVSDPDAYAAGAQPTEPEIESVAVEAAAVPQDQKPRGWLDRLRRSNVASPAPKQPRKVAYPYRVNGRPLAVRPPSADAGDAQNDLSASSPDNRD